MGGSLERRPVRQERRATFGEVRLERLARRPAEQPDPLLAALAQHPQLAFPHVEAAEVRGGELADPQPGGVRGLDEGPVAQGDRLRLIGARAAIGGLEVGVHGRDQPLDLVHLEDPRQAARQARGGDRAPRVAGREARLRRIAVEGTDRRKPLGHGRSRPALAKLREVAAQVRPAGVRQSTPREASQAR